MKKICLSILITLQCTAQAASISNIEHHALPNGGYEVIFENINVLPKSFATKQPNTIVLDFPDTTVGSLAREINVASHGIYDIDLVEGQDRTRAVVSLAAASGYKVLRKGNNIVLSLDKTAGTYGKQMPMQANNANSANGKLFNNVAVSNRTSASVGKPTPLVIKQTAPAAQPVMLTPTFRHNKGGKGELNLTLPRSVNNVSVRKDGDKIFISLDGYFASKAEQKRMEVDTYNTPVSFIDIFRRSRGTELVLNIKRNSSIEYSAYQNGDIYTVEVQPEVDNKDLQKQVDELQGFSPSKKYTGAPLSLNFQDIEVRAVLQIIAEFTNNNIVVSDAVTGNITLRLDSVPWDQALDIILKTKGLGMRENGSVIYIAPAGELDQRELDALKVIQERDELVPARTELIQIKYANATDLANIIQESRDRSGTGDDRGYLKDSILSSKGSVSVDARTNTLLVSDIPSKLQAVRDLVASLDEPVRQVLVDARLVLTSDNFSRELGAKLGLSFFNSGGRGVLAGSGNASSASALANNVVENALADGDKPLGAPGLPGRLGVNLPTASSGASYGLAILGADFLVDLELSALQTEGKAEIVSSPRVVTQDGKKAHIASGQEIPYETRSSDGTKVEFKKAELYMDVTPRIAPDSRVDMLLDISNDKPDRSLASSAGNVGLSTNQLETNVLVDNGETIVLGGIYQQEQTIGTSKVPLLGDLPIIGNAFKSTNKNYKKSELLIFVTPRIIDNRLSDYDKFSNLRK